MSSRDRQSDVTDYFNDDNLYPFHRYASTSLYDMERFNDEYWLRLRNFLEMTYERDIIVQIEIWDRWDFGADREPYPAKGWSEQPYNPVNNINYTSEERGLPKVVNSHSAHPFFMTTPNQEDNQLVLKYQEAFVDKMLSITLEYPHVLYCISNESIASEQWSTHWAQFVSERAEEIDVDIYITEMWNHWDLTHPMHRRTYDHPELYDYVDISQNNHQEGQTHWDNMQKTRQIVFDPPRPMDNVKIYGGTRLGGGLKKGAAKFWRNILGGMASARFHRPGSEQGYYGAGLGPPAQTNIRSMRMFTEEMNVFASEPANNLLSNREENEAYAIAEIGRQYAVYFLNGGSVGIDLSDEEGQVSMQWLDINNSEWQETVTKQGGGIRILTTDHSGGPWAIILKVE